MSIIFLILSFVSVVAGLILGIITKDLRILGTGIILGVLFWTLGFTTPDKTDDDEQRRRDTES
jgi:hypothetical protein